MNVKVKIVQVSDGEWDVFVANAAEDKSIEDLVERAVQTVLDSTALGSECPTTYMPVDDGMRDLLITTLGKIPPSNSMTF